MSFMSMKFVKISNKVLELQLVQNFNFVSNTFKKINILKF